jgi:hypothetical protein
MRYPAWYSLHVSGIPILDELFPKEYELVRDAPQGMPWEEYERITAQEWNRLISGPQNDDELVIHRFLEQNPCLIPGPFSFPTSGHGPVYGGVFSRPPLTGINTRVPDFMWLASATDIIFPVLVEIETPAQALVHTGRPSTSRVHAGT